MKEILKTINTFYSNKGFIKFTDDYALFYDYEFFLRLPFQSEIKVTLEADPLLKLYTKFDTQIQIIKNDENVSFSVNSLNIQLPIVDIPFPDVKEIQWKKLPNNFMEALNFCSATLSTNNSDGLLTCFYINKNLYTCDNYRLTEFLFDREMSDSFLIPGNFYKRMKSTLWTHYSLTNNFLYFKKGDLVIGTNILNDDYIDIEDYFNVDGVQITDDLETIQTLVDNASFLLSSNKKARDEFILLQLKDNVINCTSKQSKGSTIESDLLKNNYPEISFKINPHLFNEIADHSSNMIIGGNVLLFSGKNFKQVLCMGGV